MDSQNADQEERVKDPSQIVIILPRDIFESSGAGHPRDQEQVDDPPDEQDSEGEKIDQSTDRSTEIEAVSAEKTKKPQ